MTAVFHSQTVTVSIERRPEEVYAFVSNPENLPRWAPGLCRSVRRTEEGWIVETELGPMKFRFVERNDLGVLDHYVSPATGQEMLNPMRVVPNGSGSELMFTLFQSSGMSDDDFVRDAGLVKNDLLSLKKLLESGNG